jgi:hypothetical protein
MSSIPAVFERLDGPQWIELEGGTAEEECAITPKEYAAAKRDYVTLPPRSSEGDAEYQALMEIKDMPLVRTADDADAFEALKRRRSRRVAKPLPLD